MVWKIQIERQCLNKVSNDWLKLQRSLSVYILIRGPMVPAKAILPAFFLWAIWGSRVPRGFSPATVEQCEKWQTPYHSLVPALLNPILPMLLRRFERDPCPLLMRADNAHNLVARLNQVLLYSKLACSPFPHAGSLPSHSGNMCRRRCMQANNLKAHCQGSGATAKGARQSFEVLCLLYPQKKTSSW